ncbi:hypothetical protein K490DRAFT_67872 [Saccharata proteae CBS 121410]|uniref:Cora-domain-containing protein n=1 Tax=Saccharata proteae CBS 121410 TaxID=1314787 RepID=A0A9P4HT94_9PEZI|nr:hypothetical protein K490DRAFT_67872 [Saccharata proteae CBS 121410]
MSERKSNCIWQRNICFHFPFAIYEDNQTNEPKQEEGEELWRFGPPNFNKDGGSRWSSFRFLPSAPRANVLNEESRFVRRAITANDKDEEGLSGGLKLDTRWVALVSAPPSMFKSGRLVEVCLREVLSHWKSSNIKRIEEICLELNEELDVKMNDQDFWRRDVQYTLRDVSRMAEGLTLLSDSIYDVVKRDPNVWETFRKQRLSERRYKLDESKKPDEITEAARLKYLLWEIFDMELMKINASLEAKQKTMNNLRQRLVDLSQTRASLYANQLGDHVKYPTYVSILFLPLSFVTALWSMNYDVHSGSGFIATMLSTSLATLILMIFLVNKFSQEAV